MEKRKLVLIIPQSHIDKPITYYLIKDYDLIVNILKAEITPKEQGVLVLEIKGEKKNLEKGIGFLKDTGVKIQSLIEDIKWDEKKCIHCTQCLSICPTEAFVVERRSMRVDFNKDKCIACGLCVNVCPYRAMEIII